MPVLTVAAPRLHSPDAEVTALGRVTAAVADALALPHEAVHAVLAPTEVGVLGERAVPPWPVVVLHGQRRGDAEAAVRAARTAVGVAWQRPEDEVWVQWACTP